MEEIVLWKGGDVGRHGESGEVVAVSIGMIRKWTEVLRHRTIWRGCTDKELC